MTNSSYSNKWHVYEYRFIEFNDYPLKKFFDKITRERRNIYFEFTYINVFAFILSIMYPLNAKFQLFIAFKYFLATEEFCRRCICIYL